jgi:hypothetical protein
LKYIREVKLMRSICYAIAFVVFVLQSQRLLADNPDCEKFEASQPDVMVTDVVLTYTWDAECGDDPELGPLSRDGEEISVEWSHDLDSEPHEHTASDPGVSPVVHQYTLVVTPPGEDGYELEDTVMVSGTEPTGDDDDNDEPEEDAGVEEEDSSDSAGCSVVQTASRISLLAAFISLL